VAELPACTESETEHPACCTPAPGAAARALLHLLVRGLGGAAPSSEGRPRAVAPRPAAGPRRAARRCHRRHAAAAAQREARRRGLGLGGRRRRRLAAAAADPDALAHRSIDRRGGRLVGWLGCSAVSLKKLCGGSRGQWLGAGGFCTGGWLALRYTVKL